MLRWHLDSGRIAVPKSASDIRQRENMDVFDFSLTEQQLAAIDALDAGAGPRLDADFSATSIPQAYQGRPSGRPFAALTGGWRQANGC